MKRTPGKSEQALEAVSSTAEVDAFLAQVAALPPAAARQPGTGPSARLLFALDATASRERTWDRATQIQAAMFEETQALGGLEVQLCHYRGLGEFQASPWCRGADELLPRMTAVRCAPGLTQIARLLDHAIVTAGPAGKPAQGAPLRALVFVGDACEEPRDRLADQAGCLRLLGVPVFVFQEGRDPDALAGLRDIAQLSGGAWCPFDSASPNLLRDLLSAVAVYAAGGRPALEDFGRRHGDAVRLLTAQLGA
nr:VWA domain-containing protein [Thiorhodovibrio winogradskyi]